VFGMRALSGHSIHILPTLASDLRLGLENSHCCSDSRHVDVLIRRDPA
jgi:hypothetical protein